MGIGGSFGSLCGLHSHCIGVTSLLLGDGKSLDSPQPPLTSSPEGRWRNTSLLWLGVIVQASLLGLCRHHRAEEEVLVTAWRG